MIPSMKKNMMPASLGNMALETALKTYPAHVCQLAFMGPKLTLLEQTSSFSSLDISKKAVYKMRTDGSLTDQKKVRSLVQKGALNSKRLQRCYARNEFEMESSKISAVVKYAKTGDTVGTFYLDHFRKPNAEIGYGMKPFEIVVTLEDLFVRIIQLACMTSITLKASFQQLPPKTKVFEKEDLVKCPVPAYMKSKILNRLDLVLLSEKKEFAKAQFERLVSPDMKEKILDLFHRQPPSEVKEFAKKDALEKCLVSADTKLKIPTSFDQQQSCETKEFAKNSEDFHKPTEKQVFSTASDNKAESQTSNPHLTSMKNVHTCDECRETIRMKKFFDERRYGILEKCSCVICYGCVRKSTGTSNGVVKGPLRCPRCFAKSDKVASSAIWIEGARKVKFFKEYCKNLQNTNIKMRLGWTRFPTRKDAMWTRAPQMVPVNF